MPMTSWAPRLAEMKARPADPGRDRPARQEEVLAGPHEPPERKADPQHEAEVDQHDQIVDPCQCGLHARFLSSSARRIAGARIFLHVGTHELLGWGDITRHQSRSTSTERSRSEGLLIFTFRSGR